MHLNNDHLCVYICHNIAEIKLLNGVCFPPHAVIVQNYQFTNPTHTHKFPQSFDTQNYTGHWNELINVHANTQYKYTTRRVHFLSNYKHKPAIFYLKTTWASECNWAVSTNIKELGMNTQKRDPRYSDLSSCKDHCHWKENTAVVVRWVEQLCHQYFTKAVHFVQTGWMWYGQLYYSCLRYSLFA